jgi:hypothetical protein
MGLCSHDYYRTTQIQRWKWCGGETNPTFWDASHAINIKVEEVSDAEEEEDPVPISFPKIKAEPW